MVLEGECLYETWKKRICSSSCTGTGGRLRPAVSAAEVKVTSDQTKVTSGSDITLTLTLDEAVDDVICFDYRVYFDEDSFSLKKSTIGTACEDVQISTKPMTYGSEQNPCYSVNFVDATSEGATIQSGEICQLTFTA